MPKQWQHWSDEIRNEGVIADEAVLQIWGYTSQPAYKVGDTVDLHVATTARTFSVRIVRDGATRDVVYARSGCRGEWCDTPANAFAVGCRWPANVSVKISEEWRPGGYVVELTAGDERGTTQQEAFFVLRPERPGRSSRLALVVATYTWQEYNDWGGGSGYNLKAEARGIGSASAGIVAAATSVQDRIRRARTLEGFAPRLSYERPWARGFIALPVGAPRVTLQHAPPIGAPVRHPQVEWALANGYSLFCGYAGWAQYEALFVRWAEERSYNPELLTQWDLDQTPHLLDAYDCVVTVGHDEYWSATGRERLDGFVEAGGRYARLAGNIMWKVRLEDQGKTQVCYKYVSDADPMAEERDRERTGAFEEPSVNDPPVTTFGANGGRGIYSRWGGAAPRGVGGFIVYRPRHWAFEGTDLYYGDVLGADLPLVGFEADGVTYTVTNGIPVPTSEDGAPQRLEILGLTPVTLEEEEHGNMGSVLMAGDGDLAYLAQRLGGGDTPAGREKVRYGAAVMTYMTKGAGEVFCGGTTEWPYALAQKHPMVERVVCNALDRFLQPRGQ